MRNRAVEHNVTGFSELSLIVAGCPLLRGCLSIEVNGRTVGTCRICQCLAAIP